MGARVYFDHSATTPIDPRVFMAMQPFFAGIFGNPSSLHADGREARAAIDLARQQVANLLGARPEEIIFTGSGTEADNLALTGTADTWEGGASHVITSSIEHPAVLETCRMLERRGIAVTRLPVSAEGMVDPGQVEQALRPDTRLISIMGANNVVGTLQPIMEIGQIARANGVLFHTDAVQVAGKIPLDVRRIPVDLVSLSAHKLHGPKGVGALYIRGEVKICPIQFGGGQERGLRSATENVAGIVGLGSAAAIASAEMPEEAARLVRLRDRILNVVTERVPNAFLIGDRYQRLPGHLCLGLEGQEGETVKLLLALDEAGISVSAGSACSAHHAGEPSAVLLAMGFDPIRARGSLRITLGRFNTDEDADRFLDVFPRAAASLRRTVSHGISKEKGGKTP